MSGSGRNNVLSNLVSSASSPDQQVSRRSSSSPALEPNKTGSSVRRLSDSNRPGKTNSKTRRCNEVAEFKDNPLRKSSPSLFEKRIRKAKPVSTLNTASYPPEATEDAPAWITPILAQTACILSPRRSPNLSSPSQSPTQRTNRPPGPLKEDSSVSPKLYDILDWGVTRFCSVGSDDTSSSKSDIYSPRSYNDVMIQFEEVQQASCGSQLPSPDHPFQLKSLQSQQNAVQTSQMFLNPKVFRSVSAGNLYESPVAVSPDRLREIRTRYANKSSREGRNQSSRGSRSSNEDSEVFVSGKRNRVCSTGLRLSESDSRLSRLVNQNSQLETDPDLQRLNLPFARLTTEETSEGQNRFQKIHQSYPYHQQLSEQQSFQTQHCHQPCQRHLDQQLQQCLQLQQQSQSQQPSSQPCSPPPSQALSPCKSQSPPQSQSVSPTQPPAQRPERSQHQQLSSYIPTEQRPKTPPSPPVQQHQQQKQKHLNRPIQP
eukprot:TRINITY_DN6549_c0_g1_i3.p1 TRINITY_DN6549_c0_g1~~TRINITY_DN6549_c0_g1_i3.p1  ORF type:complete len:485 (-),score=76.12 TRINITY_DN6549_c0_g1_i3:108-1562(-)